MLTKHNAYSQKVNVTDVLLQLFLNIGSDTDVYKQDNIHDHIRVGKTGILSQVFSPVFTLKLCYVRYIKQAPIWFMVDLGSEVDLRCCMDPTSVYRTCSTNSIGGIPTVYSSIVPFGIKCNSASVPASK